MLKYILAAAILVAASPAFAAGEWEWTAGQGWIRGAGVARPTPREQLHYSYELEQRGEFMDAARQYFLLVQNFPASQEAGVGLQRLARCLFEMENYYTSYRAIEQVIETYPNTGRMSDLVEIELRIAKKLMVSQTPDLLGGSDNPRDHNIRRALEIIASVIEHDPYGPVAAEAYLVKGEGHLFLNEVNAARTAFETIRDEFPRSDFVERARLGILTCDSLVGQASPREVAEQADMVRELERERTAPRSRYGEDELDSVEDSIRKLAEVEAAKMLEQAEQYRRMGTRQAVESSQFLYKEVARRYPNTPQADEAMERLDNVRLPREEGRFARIVKNINLNPFTYNKDPEPPWIVPQMAPEDMVMVDPGIGPIAGVPETGNALPGSATGYSVGVRPANLPQQRGGGNFSPLSAAPAPDFIDASVNIASAGGGAGQGGIGLPGRTAGRNPLQTASESDLVLPPGSMRGGQAGVGGPAIGSAYAQGGYAPQPPQPPQGNPMNLGQAAYNTPYSDLVGTPQGQRYGQPQGYGQPQAQGYYPPPAPVSGEGAAGMRRGWSMSEDFR